MEAGIGKENSLFKSFAGGGIGGMFFLVVGHPFDTMKVRMQTMPNPLPGQLPLYQNTFDCARKIFIKEGPSGFYKGMAAPFFGAAPIFATLFLGFNLGKNLQQSDPNIPCTKVQLALAGCLAGVFTTALMGPGERIKCLLQVQLDKKSGESLVGGGKHYAGPLDVVRQLYHEGGIRSVFRGTGATLLRDVPASAAYFATYEVLQDTLAPKDAKKGELSIGRTLLAGGVAGVADWLVAMPVDVLKSRLQTAPEGTYSGIRHVLVELLRTDGLLALYRGFTPVMLRAFPANAACFLGFEMTIKFLDRISP